MRIALILILFFIFMIPKEACAEGIAALEAQVKQLAQVVYSLKTTVDTQQREIADLKKAYQVKYQATSSQSTYQPTILPPKFTPEISVAVDTVAKLGSPKIDQDNVNRVSVREAELVLGSNVDPYSRLDATIAFTEDHNIDLEEAYLTRFGLPFGTTARIGEIMPKIGKMVPVHRDSIDTVDEPLVIQRYFGDEGMHKAGVDLTKILDLPLPSVHQITVGVLQGGNGDGGTAFGPAWRRPTLYGHLKNYIDISDVTNVEFGLTEAIGSNDDDASFKTNVFGLDATLNHIIGPDQQIKLQGEAFALNRKESVEGLSGTTDPSGNFWGAYTLFDVRLSQLWSTGFRFDYVEPVNRLLTDTNKAEVGISTYLTFYQSEFARWRAQFSHIIRTVGDDDNRVFLQGTFAIGEHKHKLQ